MRSLRIGLVVEGPTDFAVFKALLSSHFKFIFPDVEILYIDLQPSIDRTSGSPEGGWEMVYKWCLNNNPNLRIAQYFGSGLFANGLSAKLCDIIVVHLDSDICEVIGAKAVQGPLISELSTPAARGEYILTVINGWLWPAPSIPDDRHIPAPAVESVETWLVAGLGAEDEPEKLPEPMSVLVKIDFDLRGIAMPPKARAIRKRYKRYEYLAAEATRRQADINRLCGWFKRLTDQLHPHFVAADSLNSAG